MIKCQLCYEGQLESEVLPGDMEVLVYTCKSCNNVHSAKSIRNEMFKEFKEDYPRLYEKCSHFNVSFEHYDAILTMSRAMDEIHSQEEIYPQVIRLDWEDSIAIEFNNLTEWAALLIEDLTHTTSPK